MALWPVYNYIERPLPPVLSRMETRGVLLDRGRLAQLGARLDQELAELEAGGLEGTNPRSPLQLQHHLFEVLNLPILRRTDPSKTHPYGMPSTDEAALKKILTKHGPVPIITTLLQLRQLEKLKSTYITALLNYTAADPRIHTSFNQCGTDTGRLSSFHPNLQNIPAQGEWGKRIRSCFITDPGWGLVVGDFSQIELRIMAACSQEKFLLRAFYNNEDVHLAVTHLLGLTDRRVGKTLNFGLGYGMGPGALAAALSTDERKVTSKEGRELLDAYWGRLPGLARWMNEVRQAAVSTGRVYTMFGRLEPVNLHGDGDDEDPGRDGGVLRKAVNAVVQGTGADIMKMYLSLADLACRAEGGHLLLTVHDEAMGEAPADRYEGLARRMEELGRTVVDIGVPLKIDVHVGPNWQEAKG